MIRRCTEADFEQILAVVNDGARAYKGIIPADRCTDPYMSRDKLRNEIETGVVFWVFEEGSQLSGVMGMQEVQDVTLIRHAYVRTESQKNGIGAQLLVHLRKLSSRPVLIGTWAAASWAIRFYERHGFTIVEPEEKERLLRIYWNIPSARSKPLWCWQTIAGAKPICRNRTEKLRGHDGAGIGTKATYSCS